MGKLNLGLVGPTIAGFTGTQVGMTTKQREAVRCLLRDLRPEFALHGDCIGADEGFHRLCMDRSIHVRLYPPTDDKKRAFCTGCSFIHPSKPYLERNRDIVNACTFLIAAPKEYEEQLRSGTWATIRYCRKLHRPVHLIFPDGTVH